jgi:hypothetical protein
VIRRRFQPAADYARLPPFTSVPSLAAPVRLGGFLFVNFPLSSVGLLRRQRRLAPQRLLILHMQSLFMMIIVDIICADATIAIRRPVAKRPIIPRAACCEARHHNGN